MQLSRLLLFLLMLEFACPRSSPACLWDSDTLKEEAEGFTDVINVIVGRFPRNPAAYYEARLKIVAQRLEKDPLDLDAYDDAGVACDRLGRGDEAIDWMQLKLEEIYHLPESKHKKAHRYRYHANLGTFIIHDWIRNGAEKEEVERAEEAAEHIARALEINPDAHFGRERAQLRVMEWLILQKGGELREEGGHVRLTTEEKKKMALHSFLLSSPDFRASGKSDRGKHEENMSRGLVGMVALGNAWESVDVFSALDAVSVFGGEDMRSSIAYLAHLRVRELIEAGKKSLGVHADFSYDGYTERQSTAPGLKKVDHLEKWYQEARESADSWRENRNRYILAQLESGKHPDTDSDFWAAYSDNPKLPKFPEDSPMPTSQRAYLMFTATGAAMAFIVLLYVARRKSPST